MEVAGTVMAVIQMTGAIVEICGGYIGKVKKAEEDIVRLQQESSSLARVLQMLHELLTGPDVSNLVTSRTLFDDVMTCSSALEKLKTKIDPGTTQSSMRRFGLRALKWPLQREGVTEAINDIKGYQALFTLALQIDQVKSTNLIVKDAYDQNEKNLLHTLASDYEDYKDFNPTKVQGTCEWFFGDDRFLQWRDTNTSSLLWVSAGPGCGKSVLSRALIDEGRLSTDATNSTVCYFFFKDGDPRRMSATSALSAILHQVFTQDRTRRLIEQALPSHKEHGASLATNFSELWRILTDCSLSNETGEIVCVLDALDECNSDDRRRLIEKLKDFYCQPSDASDPASKLKFLITSRPYDDLEASFKRFSDTTAYVRFDGDENSEQISEEINLVIDVKVDEIARDFHERDRRTISDRLKSMENRTYLWLHLTLDIIEQSPSGYGRRCDVEALLSSLPSQVSEAYEKILDRSKNPIYTETLLQIVLAAERPLTLEEANLALTVALQKGKLDSYADLESNTWPPKDFKTTVKNLCGLFISVYDSKLSFIHLTAREFLIHPERRGKWQGRLDLSRSHGTMCRVCLEYLSYIGDELNIPTGEANEEISDVFWTEITVEFDNSIVAKFPLAQYSAQCWMGHARPSETQKEVQEITLNFLLRSPRAYAVWGALFNPDTLCHKEPWECSMAGPLYCASSTDLQFAVKSLLENGADVNAQGGGHSNALVAASSHGHKEVVQLLLDGGADVNVQGGNMLRTPLQTAALEGHKELAQVLLDGGADVNAEGVHFGDALHNASSAGHEEIVKLLLDEGANVNANLGRYGTALQAASHRGHAKVVQLLLDNGADVNASSGEGGNSLHAASCRGAKEVVQLLLNNHADVNAQSGEYNTALQAACWTGDQEIVQLLLDEGADVNAQGGHFGNALQAACWAGDKEIVQLLLDSGADINTQGGEVGNALQAAARGKNKEIVQLLLNEGADVNVQGGHYNSALQAATSAEHTEVYKDVVELLLNGGADVNARGGRFGNALQAACWRDDEEVVQLLLNEGADVNAQGGHFGNALQAASVAACEKIVQLLLNEGADVNAWNEESVNALQTACWRGDKKIVQLLLDEGADVNAQGGVLGNALQAACWGDNKEVVKLLLNEDVDVNAQGGDFGNALQAACWRGDKEVVQLLLDEGANDNAQSKYFDNVLQAAAAEGHKGVVQLLLDRGADVNISGKRGSALKMASRYGHEETARLLLDRGASASGSGDWSSALQEASDGGHKEIVKLLLENGAVWED